MIRKFSVAIALVAIFTACNEGDPERDSEARLMCPMDCGPTFTQELALATEETVLRTSTLTVCRNGECDESELAALFPEGSAATTMLTFPAPGARTTRGWVEARLQRDKGKPRLLSVAYLPTFTADAKDGDTFDVTLRDANGDVIVERHHVVSTYPRTETCAGACPAARFE